MVFKADKETRAWCGGVSDPRDRSPPTNVSSRCHDCDSVPVAAMAATAAAAAASMTAPRFGLRAHLRHMVGVLGVVLCRTRAHSRSPQSHGLNGQRRKAVPASMGRELPRCAPGAPAPRPPRPACRPPSCWGGGASCWEGRGGRAAPRSAARRRRAALTARRRAPPPVRSPLACDAWSRARRSRRGGTGAARGGCVTVSEWSGVRVSPSNILS